VTSLEVPGTFTELADMMLGVPAFAPTFALLLPPLPLLLLLIWHAP
jgi:hypothetical protein